MSRKILKDTVSLFNYIGESEEGEAQYVETIITYCYCPDFNGVNLSTTGRNPADGAKLYIFDKESTCRGVNGDLRVFVCCDEYEKSARKEFLWTISDRGKDYFIKHGTYDKHFVKSFKHLINGSKRMWHWEVTGT